MPGFAVIGAAISWIFVKYGKRKTLMANGVLVIVSGAIMMLQYYEGFIIGTVLRGLAFGITTTISPMFIKEISPIEHRGPLISLVQAMINIGLLVSLFLGFLLPNFVRPDRDTDNYGASVENKHLAWREILIFPVIIALIQLLCLIFIFPRENPIYELHMRTREEINIPGKINQSDFSNTMSDKFTLFLSSKNKNNSTELEEDTFMRIFKKRSERRKLFAGVIVHVLQQLSGVNIVLGYSYYFQLTNDFTHFNLRWLISIIALVGILASSYIAKIYNRKPVMLIGTLCCGAFGCILFQTHDDIVADGAEIKVFASFSNILVVITILLFTVSFFTTYASIIWVYSAEILSDKGMSIASAIHWIGYLVISYLPNLGLELFKHHDREIAYHKSNSVYFFIFSGISILGFFVITIFVKESKGFDQSEIDKIFEIGRYESFTNSNRTSSSVNN